MSKKVLVVDDEAPAAEAMSQLCQEMGLEPQICSEPDKVLGLLAEWEPDLILLDLFLPGTDGMKLAAQIRKAPGGASVGILAVSGVFKQQSTARELWGNFQADFIGKPFDNEAFKAKVSQRLGLAPTEPKEQKRRAPRRPVAKTPEAKNFTSSLAQDPAYRIYLRLYEQRASGQLELLRGKARRRITFHHGQIRHASSNLAKENVGMMQVANETIEEEAFRKAVAFAQKKKVPLAEALVKKKVMNQQAVDRALAMQVAEVATAAMGWADGDSTFLIDPEGAARTPDNRIHPLKAILDGIRRFYPTDTLKGFLGSRQAAYLVRTPLMERESYTLRQTAPGERVTPQIAGTLTLGVLMDQIPEKDLPLLFTLVGTGLLRLVKTAQDSAAPEPTAPEPEAPAPSATGAAMPPASRPPPAQMAPPRASPSSPGMPAAAPPTMGGTPTMGGAEPPAPAPAPALQQEPEVDLDAGQVFSEEEQQARGAIARMHKQIAEQSHYEVLGVAHNAGEASVQAAYLELARQWHSDHFAGKNLGAAAAKLEEVFARVSGAKEILGDKEKRAEYDVFLDRKAKGLPTDVAAILKAQEHFDKATIMVKAGKGPEALPLLQQAIELDHSQPEFFAYRAYAQFLTQGDEVIDAARAEIQKALGDQPRMPSGYYFLGALSLKAGDVDDATRQFRKVLEIDEKHAGANQQLRVIQRRQEKEKGGGGLLGRLTGK